MGSYELEGKKTQPGKDSLQFWSKRDWERSGAGGGCDFLTSEEQ